MRLEGLTLVSYRGGVALTGDALHEAHQRFSIDAKTPRRSLHITLVTPEEYKSIGRPVLAGIVLALRLDHVYALGEASSSRDPNSVRWIVVVWNHANMWRRSVGLGRKEFHITLTDTNDHDAPKGLSSLLTSEDGLRTTRLFAYVASLGIDAMDHAVVACGESEYDFAVALSERMIISSPRSFKGYVRLADLVYDSHPKTAILAFAQACRLNLDLVPQIASRIKKLSDTVSYGAVVTAEELEFIHYDLRVHLLHNFPPQLDDALAQVLWTCPTESRYRAIHNGYELPRNFSWLYPGRLAGMSTPRSERDIDTLLEMGLSHILTLTAEEPLDKKWFHLKPVEHVFIPVENYGAPTKQEMDVIYDRVRAGGTWLVHCGGGVGRAGTVLACLISMFGRTEGDDDYPRLDAKEAIRLIRHARPRSIESERQEAFVHEWVSHRWKVAHQATTESSEPVTSARIEFKPGLTLMDLNRSTAIMLIGKPGSGKSWLSTAIAKRRPKGTTLIVSQDESRSRQGCERVFAQRHADDTLVILDRCNPTIDDRKYWLSLCLATHVVAIYFDYPLELCQQRVDARIDHPRIRAGKGANALAQMDREMRPPALSEGFSAIVTVSSFAAAREVVRKISSDPPLLKFPRTPHLLDLGASTPDDVVGPGFETLVGPLTIEEKVDGANMGFSLDWDGAIRCQNRSHWVSPGDHAQFKPLDRWMREHDEVLRRILDRDAHFPERYILYGEWMVAKHSIHYTRLPDRFIAYDLYDRLDDTFLSRERLSLALKGSGISQVPLIAQLEKITRHEVMQMLRGTSAYGDNVVEGVYVRTEDEGRTRTIRRGKVVRGDFIAGNEHWSRGKITLNTVSDDAEH